MGCDDGRYETVWGLAGWRGGEVDLLKSTPEERRPAVRSTPNKFEGFAREGVGLGAAMVGSEARSSRIERAEGVGGGGGAGAGAGGAAG